MAKTMQSNHSKGLQNSESSVKITANKSMGGSMKGTNYQAQLLVLFLKRGLEKHYSFELTTEKEEAGKFDDLVFEINGNCKKEFRLLQAKHKANESKKINFNDLMLESDSEYTLVKYFFSYNDSKKQKLYKNKIKDVILFTNIDLDLDSKFESTKLGDVVKEIRDEDYILDFTNETLSRKTRKPVRYSFNDKMIDLLKPKLERYNLTRLARRLAKCIINGHTIKHHDKTDIFQFYHAALAKEVVDVNGKKFHQTFISNEKLSTECEAFKKSLEQEMIKQSNNKLRLENINEDINSKKIQLIFAKKFGNTERKTWPKNSISKEEVKDFFNHLVFAVNQPNEEDLGSILKENFRKEYGMAGSLICRGVCGNISKWLMNDAKGYISDVKGREIIEEVKENDELCFLHRKYLSQIEKLEMKFDLSSLNKMALDQFLSSEKPKDKILVIETQSSTLSAIKVNQILQNTMPKPNFFFFEIFAILNLQNSLKQGFQDSIDLLVFECKTTQNNEAVNQLCIKLRTLLQNSNNKNQKIIFIVENSDLLGEKFRSDAENFSQKLIDDNNDLCDLTLECQNKILDEKKIIFQGNGVPLRSLITDESKCFVDAKMLFQLVNGEKITIGKTSLNLGDIENYYIDQQLERRWNIKGNIENKKSTFFVTTDFEGVNENHLKENQDIVLISDINEDFEKLCNTYYNRNIHQLKEEGGDAFIWKQSHGSVEKLRNFINQQKVQCVEANVSNLSDPIIILASEPGMGKTTLTTKLEEKLKNPHHSLWVVRINFDGYSSTFERWTEDNIEINEKEAFKFLYKAMNFETLKSCEKEHDGRIKRTVADILLSSNGALNIIKYLKENKISGSALLEVMLFKQFYNEGKFHILFDGFDEIVPHYTTQALGLLKLYKAAKMRKMWITTRSYNIYNQLENELGTFSYNLRKFSQEDQRNYLGKFWKKTNFEFDDNRFNTFVNEIFNILSKSINVKTKELLTTPLHLNMFADILQDNFKNFCNSKNAEFSTEQREEIRVKLNLTKLYDNFVDRKYKRSFGESSATSHMRILMRNQKEKFIKDHKKMALHAIFSKSNLKIILSKRELEEIRKLLEDIKNGEEKAGLIIAIIDGRPRFIRRSFAEYFSAKYLWEKFKSFDQGTFKSQYIKCDLHKCLIKKGRVDVCEFLESEASNDLQNCVDFSHKEYKLQTLFARFYENMIALQFCYVLNDASAILLKIIETSLSHKINGSFDSKVVECKNLTQKFSLLRICAQKGYQQLVNILMEKIEVKDVKDQFEFIFWCSSPLWLDLENFHLNVARIFIEKFNCISTWDDCDQNHLITSIFEMEKLNVLKSCLKLNIDDLSQAMHFALIAEDIDVLPSLINEKFVDLKSQTDITSFHYFVFTGNLDKVKYYIEEKKVDINAKNSCGDCAVHFFASSNLNVVEYLVQKGADLNVRNRNEQSCMHCIVRFGNVKILKFVLEQEKVDCNIKNENGDTPLHTAIEEGKSDMAKFLIKQEKVNCNIQNKKGDTPLHTAIEKGESDMAKFLIEQKKVDCNIKNENGYTPLCIVIKEGKSDIAELLGKC